MNYNLIFVDVGYSDRFPTTIHRMNVITGDYLPPIHMEGYFDIQIDELIEVILRDRPDKIIFSKLGVDYAFYEAFMHRIKFKPYREYLNVDAFGLITY